MRRLVVAPHVDDDVLGCGGILDADTVTFYCGVDGFHNGASASDRLLEALAVVDATGGSFVWPVPPDGIVWQHDERTTPYATHREVNRYHVHLDELIGHIEQAIRNEQPDEVFIPWPSYNQDHRAVYEAALVALRPHDKLPFVPRVLIYEQPHVQHWDWATPGGRFTPTYFVPIDIDCKLALYGLMPSQVRAMRSPEMVHNLAHVRGAAVGVPHAEAFQILRWVETR